MKPIAVAEFISALYIFLTLISYFRRQDSSVSMRRLKLLSLVTILWLLFDALSYSLSAPKNLNSVNFYLIHVLNLFAFIMSNVTLSCFSYYCDAYMREKTKLPKCVFYIPIFVLLLDTIVDIIYYSCGKMVVVQEGRYTLVGTAPLPVLISYIVLLFYAPAVAFCKRKDVGRRIIFEFASFGLPIFAAIIILQMTGIDLTVIAGAIATVSVVTSLQREVTTLEIEKEAASQALAENNARMLALEDNFESLYDVDLETGKYVVYVKGDFYQQNVIDKLVEPGDYFEDLKENIKKVVYPEDWEGITDNLSKETVLKELSTKDHFDYYYRLVTPEGPLWFKVRIVYKDSQKKSLIIGAFNASDDVEAKQIAEQKAQLEEALQAAESANKAKSEFLFNMSHDIRTPMNAITGFTTLAKKYVGDEEKVNDYLDKINTSGQQLLTLVNQVLEMARIESGQFSLTEKPVNIQKECDTLITVLAGQAQIKGLKFEHHIKNIVHNSVLADDARMSSIAFNIVGNAMKYTPEGGKIDFSFEEIAPRKEGCASYTLTVTDTGIGMSEEFQKNVFEPFSREKSSTVSKIQGAGLGMSIVKKLVDFLDGSIKIFSKPGRGTKVSITLDFKINDKPEDGEISHDYQAVSFEGRRALLVEDNEMNREIVKNILADRGLLIEEVVDGDEAVLKVKDAFARGAFGYYDIILMDIQMPRMNGYEATKAIRALPTPEGVHIPIIAMTANAFEEDRQNAFEAGMDEHLSKPIEVRKMILTLAQFLR